MAMLLMEEEKCAAVSGSTSRRDDGRLPAHWRGPAQKAQAPVKC